jgi:hypothetical protein
MTAAVHGLTEIADSLALKLGDNLPTLTPGKKSSFIMPPPICRNGDWLLLRVILKVFLRVGWIMLGLQSMKKRMKELQPIGVKT